MLRPVLVLLSVVAATPLRGSVAEVEVFRGDAQVIRGGRVLTITEVGMPLLKTDTVQVPVGGAVFVRVLKNDQVVRLEEDLELKVSELAALDAPRGTKSPEQQLSELLTRRERKDVQERIAGWVVRPTAANVAAPLLESTKVTAAAPRKTGQSRTGATEGGVAAAAASSAAPPAPASADAAPRRRVRPLDADLPVLEMPEGTQRRLREAVRALPAVARTRLGKTLTVRVRRTVGGDVRVFLEGAVAVPFDVQTWAEGAMQGRPTDTWEQLEVPL